MILTLSRDFSQSPMFCARPTLPESFIKVFKHPSRPSIVPFSQSEHNFVALTLAAGIKGAQVRRPWTKKRKGAAVTVGRVVKRSDEVVLRVTHHTRAILIEAAIPISRSSVIIIASKEIVPFSMASVERRIHRVIIILGRHWDIIRIIFVNGEGVFEPKNGGGVIIVSA